MCACRFLNDCAHELKLACMQSSVSLTACVSTPADICTMQRSRLFVFIFVSIPLSTINNQPLTFSAIAVTFLMRGEEMRENCTDKSGKAWVSFCDAFPTKPPTTLHMPWQPFHLWLMTSPIVGPCAYDLLIKFVFTPRELVGRMVTHGTDVVASSHTVQSKMLRLCIDAK